MRLILLRHAKSEKALPGEQDRDRVLDPRGRKDAARIGAYLAHHALIPDGIVLSSARRARETWDCMAQALPAAAAVRFEDRLYESGPQDILSVVRDTGGTASMLLVIGHNPGLHEAARLLIASGGVEARERFNEGLPTSGLAVIDFSASDWRKIGPHSGRLDRFVTPRSIEAAID